MTDACFECNHRADLTRFKRAANTSIILLGLTIASLFSFSVLPVPQNFIGALAVSVGLSTLFWSTALWLNQGPNSLDSELILGTTGWAIMMLAFFCLGAWVGSSMYVGYHTVFVANVVLLLWALEINCD